MHALCSNISGILESGPLALATVITQSGSAPRTVGARMLILPDGSIRGSIGGGRYEALAIAQGEAIIKNNGNACILFFDLNSAGDMDMICGGDILVLIEHITPTERNMAFFEKAARAERENKSFVFVTELNFPQNDILKPNAGNTAATGMAIRHIMVRGEGSPSLPDELGPEIASVWQRSTPFIRQAGDSLWLLEPMLPAERIHILGGGHVSLALARMAEVTGFATSVLDDRQEFANHTRFPHSRVLTPPSLGEADMHKYFADCRPGERDAIVIVTRGHAFDRDALAAALRTSAGYVGMIGSSAKRKQIYASLLKGGFGEDDLKRVYSPIGVAINAETPEEIAVSIMGQLIQWRRGALGE